MATPETQRKQLSIRNALVSDKLFIETIAATIEGASPADGLSEIIRRAKLYESNLSGNNNTGEIERLQSVIDQLRSENEGLMQKMNALAEAGNLSNQKFTETNEMLTSICREIDGELKEKESYEECIKRLVETYRKPPVTIKDLLQGSQFVCELDPKTAENARKIRPFAKKDGYIQTSDPNELVNVAMKQFINRHYSDII